MKPNIITGKALAGSGEETVTPAEARGIVNLRSKCTSNLRMKVHHFGDVEHPHNGTTKRNSWLKGTRLE